MKKLSLILLIYTCQAANSQDHKRAYIDSSMDKLNDKNIYIFCRGTRSKPGIIANKYNTQDKNISHIGIGYVENKTVYIFNVNDITSRSQSALFVDSIHSFVAAPDAFYLAIWEHSGTEKELMNLKRICKEYRQRKIVFDYKFNITDDDTLYCSEFVYLILKKVLPRTPFAPFKVSLDNKLYETLLKRKELTYYPADFFTKTDLFTKVIEVSF